MLHYATEYARYELNGERKGGGDSMFKKILVPTDGPEWEEKVLPHVEVLANAFQAEVTFFNTATYGSKDEIGEAGQGVIKEELRNEKNEKHLADITNALKAKGIRANYIYKEEKMPARDSLTYAGKENEELVAVASHAKGDVSWVMGSVAKTEDDVKGAATNDTFTFIAVAVGLLISISPLLISMLF
jgi:nucleotide-binding universal stress UspA family protein